MKVKEFRKFYIHRAFTSDKAIYFTYPIWKVGFPYQAIRSKKSLTRVERNNKEKRSFH